MHEHGIADEVFRALLAQARLRGASRITGAALEVGEFSGVTEAALVHGLEHCCEHAGVAVFPVSITTVGPEGKCGNCGHEGPLETMDPCSECGGENVVPTAAKDVRIVSAEFE